MNRIKTLLVHYRGRVVGTMALYKNKVAAFEYSKEWLNTGFSISPFSLPLEKKVFLPKKEDTFEGLHGVFADSLPDGWGRLLVDRLLAKKHINPFEISCIDRLAIVGSTGMGALTYEPEISFDIEKPVIDFDKAAIECANILHTDYSDNLDILFKLGGSSGGARPKILTCIDNEEWIIKFPALQDEKNIGEKEYQYSLCAKACKIDMEETRLFPSKICSGFFGTRRFDRKVDKDGNIRRIHMISVSALLETSHRYPNLDYNILMRLTLELTKSYSEVEKMYRLMCFNVFAHNRDDHSNNFTYLYNEEEKSWSFSPAYDLTYSSSIGGEHATTINGNGVNPDIKDILEVAKNIGINEGKAKIIAKEIKEIVEEYDLIAFSFSGSNIIVN